MDEEGILRRKHQGEERHACAIGAAPLLDGQVIEE
jgi:hypothetical protein